MAKEGFKMYVISIRKIENRRSGNDRRKSGKSSVSEKRGFKDRRGNGDRRDTKDRRSAKYYLISDLQKEVLDTVLNFKR
jgi:hypothetical protein